MNAQLQKGQPLLAVIPARGGSKGIPHKNIYPVNGKPLIAHTIEAALASTYITNIVVSTDDDKIAELAGGYKKVIIIKRPAHLAEDHTPTLPVLLHALEQVKGRVDPVVVVTLQPTSPLRTASHIDDAIQLLTPSYDSCVSVCPAEHSPYKMFKIEEGALTRLIPDAKFGVPRQMLPEVYRENGAIYVTWTSVLLNKHSIWGEKTIPYIMDEFSSVDIDSINDICLAEICLKERLQP